MRIRRNRQVKLSREALRAAQLLVVHVSAPETCIMKTYLLITSGLLLAALSAAPLPAHAKTMKECAAQWQEMKAANQTAGMKYRDFTKQCACARSHSAGGWNDTRRGGRQKAVGGAGGHDRAGTRLRRRMESRQGRRKDRSRNEVAAVLERMQQTQEGRRDVAAGISRRVAAPA
jgi:hypothetical protein